MQASPKTVPFKRIKLLTLNCTKDDDKEHIQSGTNCQNIERILRWNYQEVVAMLIVDFEDHPDPEDITEAIQRSRENIKKEFPLIRFVIIQPE